MEADRLVAGVAPDAENRRQRGRMTIICCVAYGEDVNEAREIIKAAVEGCPGVPTDINPIPIFAREFANSSINSGGTWWTG